MHQDEAVIHTNRWNKNNINNIDLESQLETRNIIKTKNIWMWKSFKKIAKRPILSIHGCEN